MAIEQEDSKREEFMYSLCPTCREKVNIFALYCPNCGGRTDKNSNTGEWVTQVVYGSGKPEDYIHSVMLNDFKRCPGCHITQATGKPCNYVYCYGTIKRIEQGKCGKCQRYEPSRFSCCHKKHEENQKTWEDMKNGSKPKY
jgi:hypothetical protein